MGHDSRAIAANGFWLTPGSVLTKYVLTNGYLGIFATAASLGGIADSFGSDWRDSTGDVIFDSLGVSEPGNPLGINSILTNGYWNAVSSQLNSRIVSWGYLGSFGSIQIWLTGVTTKAWIALNSKFRLR